MTVEQLIAVLQKVPDKQAVVRFSYDSRVCAPRVTCVDYVPDTDAQDQRVFAADFFTADDAPDVAQPAVMLRNEDRDDWNFHRADDADYQNDVNLYMEDDEPAKQA